MKLREYFGMENSLGLTYSQAVKVKDTVYVAGQGPNTLECSAEDQVRQTLENVRSVLADVGLNLNDVVKITVILNFAYVTPQLFEEIYTEYFQSPFPVRTIIRSDIGFNVQVDAVAVTSQ